MGNYSRSNIIFVLDAPHTAVTPEARRAPRETPILPHRNWPWLAKSKQLHNIRIT